MIGRCYRPKSLAYPKYGAKGVRVCDRWNHNTGGSFENFLADMGPRPEGMTLGRILDMGNLTERATCSG